MKREFWKKRSNTAGVRGKADASVRGVIPTFLAGLLSKSTRRRAQNRRISVSVDTAPRREHQEKLREEVLATFDEMMSQTSSSILDCSLHSENTVDVDDWMDSSEFGQDTVILSECDGEAPMDEDGIRILQHLSGAILDTEPDTEHQKQLRAQVLAVFDESEEFKSHQKLEQIIEMERPLIFGASEEPIADNKTKHWRSSAEKLIKITKTVSFRYAAAAVFLIGLIGFFSYIYPGTAQADTDFAVMLRKIREAKSVSYIETTYREGQKPVEIKVSCTEGETVYTYSSGMIQKIDFRKRQLAFVNPKTGKEVQADLTKVLQGKPGAGDYLSYLKQMHEDSGRLVKQRLWEDRLVNEFQIKDKGVSTTILADAKSNLPVCIKTAEIDCFSKSEITTVITNINWTLQE